MTLTPTAAGSSSGSSGALTLLTTRALAADGVFDITGISGAYNDLVIAAVLGGAAASAATNTVLTFNGDGGANYDFQHLQTQATTVAGSGGVAQSSLQFVYTIPAASATVNRFLNVEAEIIGYASTSWMKQITSSYGGDLLGTSVFYRGITSGQWRSTAAINRIQLSCTGATNFAAGSVIRIYGRL